MWTLQQEQQNHAEQKEALYNEGFGKRKILTDAANVNKISIPRNLYSYFAAFKNQIHPNIKTNILLKLEDDNNIIFRTATAPASKVIVTKLRLWCPKIIFNGLGMKEYTEKYLKPKKWMYLREHHEISQTNATNSYFRISTGIRRPVVKDVNKTYCQTFYFKLDSHKKKVPQDGLQTRVIFFS